MNELRDKTGTNIPYKPLMLVVTIMVLGFSGCSEDSTPLNMDASIPENSSWYINSVMEIENGQRVPPHITFAHTDDRLHIVYYDDNPLYDEANQEEYPFIYRVRYRSFNLGDVSYLNESNTVDETISLLKEEGNSLGQLAIAMDGPIPMVAYSVNKSTVLVDGTDLGNQGDVMIAVRDNAANWRNEIGAYGYIDPARNPVIRDGLAKSDFSLKSDLNGNALLCFQFYYEGADSDNYNYRDLNYISQPVNGFINGSVEDVAEIEETVEGSSFELPSGLQTRAGDACEMVVDNDGNPVVFYYFSNLNAGPTGNTGLRMARRIDGEWQEHEWIHNDVEIVQIRAAVKSDGRLALVYTIKDGLDFDFPDTSTTPVIPYSIRYAEQVDRVVGQTEEGDDIIMGLEWRHEPVDYVSICGRYSSLDFDSEDNPVVVYFDEMNFTETRFFSRIKISRRTTGGVWGSETIVPEDIGLTVQTSPYDIDPGQHDSYYIGKYNYLWVDRNDRVNICSFSSVTNKVYFFQQR